MIKFIAQSNSKPFILFKEYYDCALKNKQNNIEAIAIASYSQKNKEVDSRFVNLKYIDNNDFIFFTNYNSPKSHQFEAHKQISGLFFWDSINVQIRIKANIQKTPVNFNKAHFSQRDIKKNALAISSNQSKPALSYDEITKSYNDTLKTKNLSICPNYWGGFSFTPYVFEFWEGHESRLNKRNVYKMNNAKWEHFIVQP